MSDIFWLSEGQVGLLEPNFPMSQGKPRVDDRHVLKAITFSNRNDYVGGCTERLWSAPDTLQSLETL